MKDKTYDIGIVGAGPAGYTAALHAVKKGLSVILFEKDQTGGVCLNRGCIPTKTILHSALLYEELKEAENLGVHVEHISVDFKQVIEHKNKTVEKIRKNLELVIKNAGILLVKAYAFIKDKNTIEADGSFYNCKKIIAATGSGPVSLKGMDVDRNFILNSDDILLLNKLPKSILIIGAGAIGIEWARIFAAFDVDVTVVEAAEHILPAADIEVSKRLERIFKTRKIKIYTGCIVEKIKDKKVHLSNGEILSPEKILTAVGRKANDTERIAGVTYLGDVCGQIQLAHFAIKQAVAEIDGIKFDTSLVPSVVYGNPETAWVGKREQDLEAGCYKKSMLLISALGKSHCDNCTEGFIKLLVQNDKIIGAHVVSKEASALIQEILAAMQNGVTVSALKEICFAHPTYSEGIFDSLFMLKDI